MQAAHSNLSRHFLRCPGRPLIVVVAHHFKLQPGRMHKMNIWLPETLLNRTMLYVALIETFQPERHGGCRDTVGRYFHLAGAFPSINASLLIGERGHDSSRRSRLVGVVKMVNRKGTVQ